MTSILDDNIKLRVLVFIFLMSFYIGLSSPHIYSDAVYYYTLTESMAIHHDLKFRKGLPSENEIQSGNDVARIIIMHNQFQGIDIPNEANLEDYPIDLTIVPIFLSAISVPFYYLANWLSIKPYIFLPMIVSPLITSLAGVLIFSFTADFFRSKRIGIALALFYGITSFIVPWTSLFYTRSTVALLVVASIYFIYMAKRRDSGFFSLFGGIFMGSIFLAQMACWSLIPPLAIFSIIYLRKLRKPLIYGIIGFFLIISLQLIMNDIKFGKPFDFGNERVNYGLSEAISFDPSFEGFYGLLISPGFGLPVYYPIFVLLPISLYFLYRYDKSWGLLFVSITVIFYIDVAQEHFWTGYGSWGPRYMIPLLPIITIATGAFIKRFGKFLKYKIVLIFLGACGFIINLLGKLVWYQPGYSIWWDALNRGISKGSDLYWNIEWSPYVNHLKILLSGWLLNYSPGNYEYGHYLNMIYKNCNYDLYFYCNYGLFPIIIMMTIMTIVVILIFKIISKERLASESTLDSRI